MEFNLADLWESVADAVPDRLAVINGERRFTFAEIEARANRLAAVLAAHGVGPGRHLAVACFNGNECLEAMLAAFKLRAAAINVNYRYTAEELQYLLADADAVACVVDPSVAARVEQIRPALPGLEQVLVVGDDYEAALADAPAERVARTRSGDDLYLLYTGGTTGRPKGVMWRHEDLFLSALGGGGAGAEPISEPGEITERALQPPTRCLPACPLIHGTAHWMALGTLFAGGTVVLHPQHHLDATALLRLIEREDVGTLVIVGDAFARPIVEALDAPDAPDVACLRVIVSGGALLSPPLKEAIVDRLPGVVLVDGYGASETGGQGQTVALGGATGGSDPTFRMTTDTLVVDDDLHPCPPGVIGRIARRGRVPLGYYKDPERSAATFPVRDGVRYAIPGDHAVVQADGSVRLLGRGSASINTGGEKVYPEEVERTLRAHPAIRDVVVVGAPDPRYGETVVALIEAEPGLPAPDCRAVQEFLRPHIAGYKLPRATIAVDAVRRSAVGKADIAWARALASSATATRTAQAPPPTSTDSATPRSGASAGNGT